MRRAFDGDGTDKGGKCLIGRDDPPGDTAAAKSIALANFNRHCLNDPRM